jgi:hypothetical protein
MAIAVAPNTELYVPVRINARYCPLTASHTRIAFPLSLLTDNAIWAIFTGRTKVKVWDPVANAELPSRLGTAFDYANKTGTLFFDTPVDRRKGGLVNLCFGASMAGANDVNYVKNDNIFAHYDCEDASGHLVDGAGSYNSTGESNLLYQQSGVYCPKSAVKTNGGSGYFGLWHVPFSEISSNTKITSSVLVNLAAVSGQICQIFNEAANSNYIFDLNYLSSGIWDFQCQAPGADGHVRVDRTCISASAWHVITMIVDFQYKDNTDGYGLHRCIKFYVDGVRIVNTISSSGTNFPASFASDVTILAFGGLPVGSYIDDCLLASVVKSEDWIRKEVNMLLHPETFFIVGAATSGTSAKTSGNIASSLYQSVKENVIAAVTRFQKTVAGSNDAEMNTDQTDVMVTTNDNSRRMPAVSIDKDGSLQRIIDFGSTPSIGQKLREYFNYTGASLVEDSSFLPLHDHFDTYFRNRLTPVIWAPFGDVSGASVCKVSATDYRMIVVNGGKVYLYKSSDGRNWGEALSCTGFSVNYRYPSFIYDGTNFHLYINKESESIKDIYHFVSSDSLAWTVQNSGSPVIVHGTYGDGEGLWDPASIIYNGSIYVIFFCRQASGYHCTGVCHSTDGLTGNAFNAITSIIAPTETYESEAIWDVGMCQLPNGKFLIVYRVLTDSGSLCIAYADAPDGPYTKVNLSPASSFIKGLSVDISAIAEQQLMLDGNKLLMLYSCNSTYGATKMTYFSELNIDAVSGLPKGLLSKWDVKGCIVTDQEKPCLTICSKNTYFTYPYVQSLSKYTNGYVLNMKVKVKASGTSAFFGFTDVRVCTGAGDNNQAIFEITTGDHLHRHIIVNGSDTDSDLGEINQNWHYYAIHFLSDRVKFYLDGVQQGSDAMVSLPDMYTLLKAALDSGAAKGIDVAYIYIEPIDSLASILTMGTKQLNGGSSGGVFGHSHYRGIMDGIGRGF